MKVRDYEKEQQKQERKKWPKHEVHLYLYEQDWRAFRILMAKNGDSSPADTFHDLDEIKKNQPPAKLKL